MGAIVLSFLATAVMAQTQPAAPVANNEVVQTFDYRKNPTVASILSKYESQFINTQSELSNADFYPVLGEYTPAAEAASTVSVVLDAENRGVVWIDGLPQGKLKAYLRKSPAVYKIPAQKTAEGKDIAEGTLVYDKENNVLNILIGKEFNAADPTAVFIVDETAEVEIKGKTKTKKSSKASTWSYTGSKVIVVKEEVEESENDEDLD